MGTTKLAPGPHNHWRCRGRCNGKPLTLADRELITGRSIVAYDDETGHAFCGDCLADLPAGGYEALFHVCGEETPAAAPAGEATAPEPQPEPDLKAVFAKVGDVVLYHGDQAGHHGIWEVTCSTRRGLRLFDVDEALWDVPQSDVTVVQTAAVRRRLLKKLGLREIGR